MNRTRSAARILAAGLLAASAGHAAESPEPYRPDRRDYKTFREAYPDVLEPNYLPFMVHRLPADDAVGDVLVFCRWPDEAMPLRVAIEPPGIPESLQNEFAPVEAGVYTAAAESALARWEAELEGLVRFQRVDDADDAQIVLRLVGAVAPEPDADHRVLGQTRLAGSCRAEGWDPEAERLQVHFDVPELRVYVADGFGLLDADQVEWITLHEIGHALGMRAHSPIPSDLMYEVVREPVHVPGLSTEDVNSFVSLYQLPNGAVFGHARPRGESSPPPPRPPTGPPMLAPGPYVDAIRGFELRLPDGWLALETARGMVAVDGLTWDYTASFQIVVARFASIDAYLARYAPYYRARGIIRGGSAMVVHGRPAQQATIESFDGRRAEEVTLIELGDGRVMVVTADAPLEAIDAYRPWFRAALGSLEVWSEPAARRRQERAARAAGSAAP